MKADFCFKWIESINISIGSTRESRSFPAQLISRDVPRGSSSCGRLRYFLRPRGLRNGLSAAPWFPHESMP